MAFAALVREDGGAAFALRRTVNTISAGVMFPRRSLIFKSSPHVSSTQVYSSMIMILNIS